MVINRGRLINFVSGITGVTPGGQAIVNLPVNRRYHRLTFQVSAVNYTGGTGLATVKITGSGADNLTVTPTIVNGVITAVAVVAGGTGYTTGDTVTITDATGSGFVGTVTANAGVVTAVAITSIGVATPVSPVNVVSSLRLSVNGINMRDILPADVLRIAQMNGYLPILGELPIFFTQPWRKNVRESEANSWDLFGQSTFDIQFGISSNWTSPNISGVMEFDFNRNARPKDSGSREMIPFLQPTAQHAFSMPIPAGRFDVTTLPFSYPISRIWLRGSTANQLTQLEVYQDGNKILEVTLAQLRQVYGEYGFSFNPVANVTIPNGNIVGTPYDMAYVADIDQRFFKALKVENDFTVRVYSAIAQTLTLVMETLPGSFAS